MMWLLVLLLLLLPSLAHAQTGFILVGPGTQRATCTDITAPVTNQTWCADGSLGPTGYNWFIWNGTAWVPITGGGGGGAPGAPLGSAQYNANGAFGGSLAPIFVKAFTTATGCSGGSGTNGRSLQCAIDAAPIGGLVQLEPVAYSVTDVSTLSITKALTIQGTNLGKSYTPDAAPTTNSRITGGGAQTIFTVNTGQAVVFRDFSMLIGNGGTGGIGISLTAPIVNGLSLIERVAFYNGAKGILGVEGKTIGTTVRDNYFYLQSVAGLHFGGYRNPNALIGGQPTNCDAGGYTIDNNYFFGNGGDTGMLFDNSAAVSMTSNQGTGFNHMLRIRVGVSSPCVGPGPTQWQVRGNQFELNGRTGPTVHLEDTYGTGLYEFVGNFFGATQSLVNTAIVQLDVTFLFGFVFANNTTGGGVGPSVFVHGLIQDSSFSDNSLAFPVFFITGNITSGSPIITNINLNTSFMPIGTTVSGAGIPIGSKVLTVDSPTQVTMTQNATATTVANLMGVASQPALRIDAASYGVMVTNNTIPNPVPGHKHWDCDGCTIISPYNGDHAQNLSTLPAAFNGSEMFCTDCSRTQPCITGGVGATARRVEGAWLCLDQAPTFTGAGLSESNTALQNRTNLLAMIAALPVAGGRIQLPTGTLNIDNTTPLAIAKAVVLEGSVGASPSGTVFLPTSGTQDLFVVTTNYPVQFRNFTIRRDTPATAGAFIHLNATSGNNGGSTIERVALVGCFVCVDIQAAAQWEITDGLLLSTQSAGAIGVWLRSADAGFGGGVVKNSTFGNGSALGTAIKVESGALFNFHHNFFFQQANHVLIDWTPAASAVGGLITNNIFNGGNLATDGVSLRTQGGGGTFTNLVISDNVFSAFSTANITTTAGALYDQVVISGNTLPVGTAGIGIDTRVSTMNIVGNIFSGSGSTAGINIRAAAVNTNHCANQFVGSFGSNVIDAGTGTTTCTGGGGGGGVPGAPSGSLQYNNAGAFAGTAVLYAAAYGLSTGGSAASNTTAMNTAIGTFIAAGGGTLILPPGSYALNTTSTITVPAIIQGESTTLALAAAQTAFTVGTTSPVTIRNITFSGGANGVLFSGTTNGTGSLVEDNIFTAQTTAAVNFQSNGNQWTVRRNIIQNTTTSGVLIANVTDSCECVIEGNSFAGNLGTAAINWLGGGDLRVINNKFNLPVGGSASSIRLHNQGAPTSEVLIANNVLSNGAHGVLIDGTVDVGRITITGNQLNSSNGSLILFNTTTGTSDLFIVSNHLTVAASPIIDLQQGDRIFVESNAFLANAAGVTAINIAAAASHATIGINNFSLVAPGAVEVANASGTTIFKPGLGVADQVAVWKTVNTLTGYPGFEWRALHRIFTTDQLLTVSNPSGFDVDAAILGSGSITIDEVDGTTQFIGSLASYTGILASSPISALVATEFAVIHINARDSAIMANNGGEIIGGLRTAIIGTTNGIIAAGATDSVILGGVNGTIGSSTTRSAVLGGDTGTIAGSLTSAVSINGGVVTTNNTTGFGGNIDHGTTTWTNDFGNVAVIASATSVVTGVANVVIDSGLFAAGSSSLIGGALTQVQNSAIIASDTSTITGGTQTAIVASIGGTIGDGAKYSAIIGGGGSIGDGCQECVVIGTGVVPNTLQATVAMTGGTATENSQVFVGGTLSVAALSGANGQYTSIRGFSEELTILIAPFTDTTLMFPANSTSLGCTVRVTTVIPTAVTFDTGVSGATTRYATGTSTAANTTGGSAVFSAYTSATSVRITPNLMPLAATGKVRVTCTYIDVTPPSS